MRVLGLMSGTSLDGVTGVVAEFVGDRPGSLGWSILGSGTDGAARSLLELLNELMCI